MTAPSGSSKKGSPNWQVAVNHLLLSLMLTCTAFPVLQLAQGSVGLYIVPLVFLVALESAYTSRKAADFSSMGSEWLFMRISEGVSLTCLAKAAYYVFTPGTSLLADLPLWQTNILYFFSGGFFIVGLYLVVIWAVSQSLAANLHKLEENPDQLTLERQGQLRNNRDDVRRSLIGTIFILGGILLFLSTGLGINSSLNLHIPFLPQATPDMKFGSLYLLLFFWLGFGLLSQSQLAILKARWYINQVPVSPEIVRKWMPYSLGLLLLVTIVAFLLPTQYAYGLFALIKSAVGLVLLLAGFLLSIVAFPFAGLLHLLSKLLGGSPAPTTAPDLTPKLPLPAPLTPTGLPAWVEIARSVLFWAVFISVIILSIRFYLQQNAGIFRAARTLPIIAWLTQVWRWLRSGFRHIGGAVSTNIQSGLHLVQDFILRGGKNISPVLNLSRRLPPRQQVLLVYLFMLRWNDFHGFRRETQQTPNEYARVLSNQVPELKAALEAVTRLFMAARYSPHPVSPEQADEAHNGLERIQTAIQSHVQAQAHPQES